MNVIRFQDLIAQGRVAGQRVFIRADLNVPQDDAGQHHRGHAHPRLAAVRSAWRWTPAPR